MVSEFIAHWLTKLGKWLIRIHKKNSIESIRTKIVENKKLSNLVECVVDARAETCSILEMYILNKHKIIIFSLSISYSSLSIYR